MSTVELTEQEREINDAHEQRWAEAIAEYGHAKLVPWDVRVYLSAQLRNDWLVYYGRGGEGSQLVKPKPKDHKTMSLKIFCETNLGSIVTAKVMAGMVGCSEGTVHAFIGTNRGRFRSTGHRGEYCIIDPDAERAGLTPTLPSPAPLGVAVPSDTGAAPAATIETQVSPRFGGGVGKP